MNVLLNRQSADPETLLGKSVVDYHFKTTTPDRHCVGRITTEDPTTLILHRSPL